MRIEAYNQVQQIYSPKRVQQTAAAVKTAQTDKVEFSSIGKDLANAKKLVKDAPDVREDVVAPLKAAVKNGTYNVSDEEFTNKLLESWGAA